MRKLNNKVGLCTFEVFLNMDTKEIVSISSGNFPLMKNKKIDIKT